MKKLLLIAAIFMSVNLYTFAASGFEGIINIPAGISIGVPMGESGGVSKKIGVGFDAGIVAQIGYVIDFKNNIGLSILGETGYSYDTYSYSLPSDGNTSVVNTSSFHSFQIGFLPKVNIKDFSIGIGAGLKIPVAGAEEVKSVTHSTNYTANGMTINMVDIVNKYDKMNVIPYVKLTFDYSVFNNYNVGANFGLYVDYEFGLRQKINEKQYVSTDAFGIGLQIGLRFSPFNTHNINLNKKE